MPDAIPTPCVDALERRRRRRAWFTIWVFIALSVIVIYIGVMGLLRGAPERFSDDVEHLKYGSVGSDNLKGGMPYALFRVLPAVFSNLLPQNGQDRYEAMGFMYEENNPGRPIGFSQRRVGFQASGFGLELVGLNCGLCHVSAIRNSREGLKVIPGMPGHTADAEAFFVFLFKAARDPRFRTDVLLPAIEKDRGEALRPLPWIGYWVLTGIMRGEIKKLEEKFCFIHDAYYEGCELTREPAPAGPGRIDTWGPYKVLRLQTWPWFYRRPYTWIGLDKVATFFDSIADLTPRFLEEPQSANDPVAGFADAPSIWNLDARMGRGFHWDGNTVVLKESGMIAALGVAATPATVDLEGLTRITRWARHAQSPRWDELVPEDKKIDPPPNREKGEALYRTHCASCHSPGGKRFGLQERVGTDAKRLEAFTLELAGKFDNKVGVGYEWKPRYFKKTTGYSNVPLDGIWLRAPYLHNGSVPTLRHLLHKPCHNPQTPDDHDHSACRPAVFYRGNDVYDWNDVGFTWNEPRRGTFKFFEYKTDVAGNGNGGHLFGTDLDDEKKTALLEYLKTL